MSNAEYQPAEVSNVQVNPGARVSQPLLISTGGSGGSGGGAATASAATASAPTATAQGTTIGFRTGKY